MLSTFVPQKRNCSFASLFPLNQAFKPKNKQKTYIDLLPPPPLSSPEVMPQLEHLEWRDSNRMTLQWSSEFTWEVNIWTQLQEVKRMKKRCNSWCWTHKTSCSRSKTRYVLPRQLQSRFARTADSVCDGYANQCGQISEFMIIRSPSIVLLWKPIHQPNGQSQNIYSICAAAFFPVSQKRSTGMKAVHSLVSLLVQGITTIVSCIQRKSANEVGLQSRKFTFTTQYRCAKNISSGRIRLRET